jgi:ATP-binding cassette subfamily F protein 3
MLELMPDATEAQRRTRLGTYGFGADKADTQCAKLSGGEKARLLLALAAFHGPHLLILDEPTNHLDVDSREALVHALTEFEGAVILISHDRHLIEACADRLWVVRDGTVSPYENDIEAYRNELLADRGETTSRKERSSADANRTGRAEQRRAAADKRALLAPLKKAMQSAEKTVEKLTAQIAKLDALLADPQIYERDAARAQSAGIERGQLVKQLAQAEDAWLEASEEYERASAENADTSDA